MIRALMLITAIATPTVVIAPTALGEGRLAPLYSSGLIPSYRDAGERAAARSGTLATAPKPSPLSGVQHALAAYPDAPLRAVPISTAAPTTVEVGNDSIAFDWSQLGIGVALGIALALGGWLAAQALRARPFAH